MVINNRILERDISFRKDRLLHNIKRGMYLSQIFMIIIILNLIMVSGTTLSPNLLHPSFFHCSIICGVFFLFNIIYYVTFKKALKRQEFSIEQLNKWERAIFYYIFVSMFWGTTITLMNQSIFYHLIVYAFCCLFCSVLFYTSKKQIIITTLFSTVTLLIALPFFQDNEKLLYTQFFYIGMIASITFILSHIMNQTYIKSYLITLSLLQENEQNAKLRDQLILLNKKLDTEVYYDELTQLYNRRGYKRDVTQLFNEADGKPLQLTLMMMDIDYFKQYNDTYGHKMGDQVLYTIGQTLAANAHKFGCIIARWGGEEFIAICETQNSTVVQELCSCIQTEIQRLEIPHETSAISDFVTISIGTSTKTCLSLDDTDQMISNADTALYKVKNSDRNNFSNAFS